MNLLQELKKETLIWLLRQAGRYMPEYMNIRKESSDFLDLCYDTKKIEIVTLQPIRRFDLDMAIIFSDILIIPDALGWKVSFEKNEGPVLESIKEEKCLEKLNNKFDQRINNIYQAISNVRSSLQKGKHLIGFAGAPWTVACYMIDGKNKKDFQESKLLAIRNKQLMKKIINILTYATIEHLKNQIKAGADIVMIFDSWSGLLVNELYEELVIEPTRNIVEKVRQSFQNIPIIGFHR